MTVISIASQVIVVLLSPRRGAGGDGYFQVALSVTVGSVMSQVMASVLPSWFSGRSLLPGGAVEFGGGIPGHRGSPSCYGPKLTCPGNTELAFSRGSLTFATYLHIVRQLEQITAPSTVLCSLIALAAKRSRHLPYSSAIHSFCQVLQLMVFVHGPRGSQVVAVEKHEVVASKPSW